MSILFSRFSINFKEFLEKKIMKISLYLSISLSFSLSLSISLSPDRSPSLLRSISLPITLPLAHVLPLSLYFTLPLSQLPSSPSLFSWWKISVSRREVPPPLSFHISHEGEKLFSLYPLLFLARRKSFPLRMSLPLVQGMEFFLSHAFFFHLYSFLSCATSPIFLSSTECMCV